MDEVALGDKMWKRTKKWMFQMKITKSFAKFRFPTTLINQPLLMPQNGGLFTRFFFYPDFNLHNVSFDDVIAIDLFPLALTLTQSAQCKRINLGRIRCFVFYSLSMFIGFFKSTSIHFPWAGTFDNSIVIQSMAIYFTKRW